MRNFGKFELFFGKLEKISTWSWKIGKILEFFFKFPLLGRPFFSKKKCLWFCSKFAQMKFRPNKFAKFWNIRDFFWKSWKKSSFKFEIWQNFKLEIEFFSSFSKKVPNIPKFGKFIYSEIHLSKFWARSEKLLSRDFYKGFPYKKKFAREFPYKISLKMSRKWISLL